MKKCEICNKTDFTIIATEIREGKGRIAKCANCGLVIQQLEWGKDRLRKYYEKEYQTTNSLILGKEQSPEEHYEDRMKTIGSVFQEVRKLLRSKYKVLEVGCGCGELLSLIRPRVKKCVGVELNTPFVNFIKDRLGIEGYSKDINNLKLKDKFDLVISISTLDHLPNPLATLQSMKKFLKPGGRIYLEVPNIDEALNRFLPEENRILYNKFFWHKAHLFYFSADTLSALFKKAGMTADIYCRHEYTLKNFLNWYFSGRPQPDFTTGLTDAELFLNNSDFGIRMNRMFKKDEKEFKKITAETFGGDNLCCVASL